MPVVQTNTVVYTYSDVVEQLLDLHEINRDAPLNQRNARRAIESAYRDLPNKHPWSYYFRRRLLQTAASYSTGAIGFDFTGGTYERQLTLASGTWPTWAYYGRVIIADVHYEVEDRKSDTVLTLREDSNPGQDVASSTAYTIYRNAYPLPANFRRLGHLWDIDQQRVLPFVDQQDEHDSNVSFYDTPDTPWQYTIRGTNDYYAAMQVLFGPPPSALKTYDLLYEASPRPLNIDSFTTGTVAVSSTTVTLTGGTWPTNVTGSILRLSNTPDPPTNTVGSNPFASQHVIKSRTSGSVVVIEEAGSTVNGVGFSVSDPIDVEPGAMLNYFLRASEAEFCSAAGRKDANARMAKAQMALIEAIESDTRPPRKNGVVVYDPFSHTRITDG